MGYARGKGACTATAKQQCRAARKVGNTPGRKPQKKKTNPTHEPDSCSDEDEDEERVVEPGRFVLSIGCPPIYNNQPSSGVSICGEATERIMSSLHGISGAWSLAKFTNGATLQPSGRLIPFQKVYTSRRYRCGAYELSQLYSIRELGKRKA